MNELMGSIYISILSNRCDQLRKEKEQLEEENTQLKIQLLEKKCSDKDIEYKEKIKLQQRIDKAIEYIEYNNEDLYVYNPDYDYEENIVSNYDATTFREDLLEILKGKK